MKFLRMRPGFGEQLIAEGDVDVAEEEQALIDEFRRQLDQGMWAAVPTAERTDAAVVFTAVIGGGQVTDPVRVTNAQGIATVGQWRLGTTAGPQTLSAQVTEVGVTGNPVLFTATATAGSCTT